MEHVWIITHGHPREGGDVMAVLKDDETFAFARLCTLIRESSNSKYEGPQSIERRVNGDPFYFFDGVWEWFSLDRHPVTEVWG